MYVDIHCHLDHEACSESLPSVLERASKSGVKVIISNGTSLASNEKVKALCEKFPLIRPAYGLYPDEPGSAEEDCPVFEWIRREALSGAYAPVAIGEIGLDGVNGVSDAQRIRFRAACALASELRLPIIVHSRKAEKEVFEELENLRHPTPVIMHCFGGSKKLVEEGVKRKYYFSIPATVSRATQFQMIVQMVPLSNLFTETDSPYLSADKEVFPNEPSSVVKTVEVIAQIKKINVEECKQVLFMNYQRIFS